MVSGLGFARGTTLNLFESGTLVSGGYQIFRGKDLYTEIFSFYGPLTYLFEGVAGLLGPGLVSLLVWDVLRHCAMAACVYVIVAYLSGRRVASLMAPVSLAVLGALADRALFPLLAVVALTRYDVTHSRFALFGMGLFSGAAILYYQDAGAAWLLAAGLVLVIRSVRKRGRGSMSIGMLAWAFSGFVCAVAPVAIWLAASGSLKAALYQCFVFPNTIYTGRSATGYITELVASWAGVGPVRWIYKATFYALPYLVVLSAAAYGAAFSLKLAATGELSGGSIMWTRAALGVFSLLQVRTLLASVDESKLAAAAAPVVATSLAVLLSRPSPRKRCLRLTRVAFLVFLLVWPMQAFAHRERHASHGAIQSTSGRLKGIGMAGATGPDTSMAELQYLISLVDDQTRPGDPIVVLPTSPYLYYLTRRTNLLKFDYLDPVYVTADEDHAMASRIAQERPRVILLSTGPTAWPGPSERLAPETYRTIGNTYRARESFGNWVVMVPLS